MTSPGAFSIRHAWQSAALAAVSAMAYYLSFRLNQKLDPWALFDQGISLVFLPAGIKHLSILLAGASGAVGCFGALMLLSFEFWPDISVLGAATYSGISTLASWLGIRIGLQALGIHPRLDNLRFAHLPMLDVLTTALHGLVVNLYFLLAGMKQQEWLMNALAMMLGDFTGSFIVLTLLWTALVFRPRPGREA
jgi:hypothetical protein